MNPDVTPKLTVVAKACSTLFTAESLWPHLPFLQLPVSLNIVEPMLSFKGAFNKRKVG
jgi:hypothetical protein